MATRWPLVLLVLLGACQFEVVTYEPGGDDEAPCGNGQADPGEECDDGDRVDGNRCTNACQWARCGDGIVRAGVEDCEPGQPGCSAGCLVCEGPLAAPSEPEHCFAERPAATFADGIVACGGAAHLASGPSVSELADAFADVLWTDVTDEASEGTWVDYTGENNVYRFAAGEGMGGTGENCSAALPSLELYDLSCQDTVRVVCETDGWFLDAERRAYRVWWLAVPVGNAPAACTALSDLAHLALLDDPAEPGNIDNVSPYRQLTVAVDDGDRDLDTCAALVVSPGELPHVMPVPCDTVMFVLCEID